MRGIKRYLAAPFLGCRCEGTPQLRAAQTPGTAADVQHSASVGEKARLAAEVAEVCMEALMQDSQV